MEGRPSKLPEKALVSDSRESERSTPLLAAAKLNAHANVLITGTHFCCAFVCASTREVSLASAFISHYDLHIFSGG